MRIKIELNGTDKNPYEAFGLTQNPFPQLAEYEYADKVLHLQALGGMPIPNTDYIREHLKGYSEEFIELCCRNFVKNKYVTFYVHWN